MKNKGMKTKNIIINESIKVFKEKGYTAVTMTDICHKTNLSRGGLYRYFSSTKDIFIEILRRDLKINKKIVEENIEKGVPAKSIISVFFDKEIESIFSNNNGFYFAVVEFAFAEPDQRDRLNKRVKESINIIKMILKYGKENDEFKDINIETLATHIIYFIDSFKTKSSILDMSKEMVERQINLLKSMIFK